MSRAIVFALCLASPVLADDWRALDEAGITTALSARVLQYEDGSTQNFFSDGRTLYRAGAGESWGKWWVSGEEYCSTWPPSDVPACCRVEVRAQDIRFASKNGDLTVGRYLDP